MDKSIYLTPEQPQPKKGNLVTIQCLVGSLIVSPKVDKKENEELFNQWLKETYK